MKRILALGATGLLTLMFAGPAQAVEATHPTPTPTPTTKPAAAATCDKAPQWVYRWNGVDTVSVSLTVKEASTGLCDAVTFQASSYVVPDSWDRKGFNETAVVQHKIEHKPITVPAGTKDTTVSSKLDIGTSGPYQVDLYRGPQQDIVTIAGSNDFLAGGLVDRGKVAAGQLAAEVTPAQLTPVPPTCTEPGSLTLTNADTYSWGKTLKYTAPGTYTVTATAAKGFTFVDSQPAVSFDVTVLPATGPQSEHADAACYVAPAAVPTPLPTADSTVAPEPVVAAGGAVLAAADPAAATPATPVVTAADSGVLASTGINGLPWMLAGAAMLIGIGTLTLLRLRRVRRVRG